MDTITFRCPLCNESLNTSRALLSCTSCFATFGFTRGNIPDFAQAKDCHDGPIPKESLRSFVERVDHVGWAKAFTELLETLPAQEQSFLLNNILRESRAAWKYLLRICKDKRVLNLGCGFGGISIPLARSSGHVVCFDLAAHKLEFVRKRSEWIGLRNLSFVRGGDTLFLPFPTGYFGLVVLNRILPSIPQLRKADLKQIHLNLLKEIHRVLQVGGECYAHVGNNCSYKYLLSKSKHYTSLLFAAVMPRRLLDTSSNGVKEMPIRNYTYSIYGYRKLFSQAGFNKRLFFIPDPGELQCSSIHNAKENYKLLTVCSIRNPTLRLFSSSFGIVGAKGTPSPSFAQELVKHVVGSITDKDGHGRRPCHIHDYVVSTGNKVSIIIESGAFVRDNGPDLILKIPMNPDAHRRLLRNNDTLNLICNNKRIPPLLRRSIPKTDRAGDFQGTPYFVEELMPGVSAQNLKQSFSRKDQLIDSVLNMLMQFHLANTQWVTVDTPLCYDLFVRPFLEVSDYVGYDKSSSTLCKLISAIERMVLGTRLPLVWSHGDFSFKNIMVDKGSGKIVGLIDWDLSSTSSLPLTDLLHCLVRLKMVGKKLPFCDVLINYLFPMNFEDMETDALSAYLQSLSMISSLIRPLSIMYWIGRIQGHIGSSKNLDITWVKRNWHNIVEHLCRNL